MLSRRERAKKLAQYDRRLKDEECKECDNITDPFTLRY